MIQQEATITYYTVTLGPLSHRGDALAVISMPDETGLEQEITLPVPAGLPGERVTIAVETPPPPQVKKRRRRRKPRPPCVWITALHEASPLRVQPRCPVFGTCGGCQLQHMQYEAQLQWKHARVQQLLLDAGFADPPLLDAVPCAEPWHYRNHMRFSVNRSGQPGLTARNSHFVLPLAHCPIAHEHINQALALLSQHTNPRPQVVLRCGAASGQLLMQPPPPTELAQQLEAAGLHVCSETMEEQLGGEVFRIRPSSFFQTNTAQAEKMLHMVLEGFFPAADTAATREKQPTLVDAYCGVGTFARVLAHHAARVIAIEESPSAIKDAQWNLRHTQNVEILKGKVEDLLPELAPQIDGLIIDPPRAGCQPVILDALSQHPVTRIIYVSCDPSTLARDLAILCHHHSVYQLRSVQPLDMFPHTAHIECVAVLERVSL